MTAAEPPMTHWVAPGKFAFHSAQLCFEASPPIAGQGGTLGLLPTIVAFAQESIPRHVLLSGRSYGLSKEASAGSESTAKPAARAKVKRMDLFPLAGRSACCGECCSGKAAALYRQHRRHAQRLGLRGAGHRARGSAGRVGPVHVGVAVDIRDPDLRRLLRRDRPGIR